MLIAEDDENLGRVLARGLREQGYVVDVVPDGETAASYLRVNRYQVAVLDWRMPRLSGLDLVRRLRRGGPPTPVLMLTARAVRLMRGQAQMGGLGQPLQTRERWSHRPRRQPRSYWRAPGAAESQWPT